MGTSDPRTSDPSPEHVGQLVVPPRFCGPPDTANGGYVAGRLAALVDGSDVVQVTLREPPPVDTPLDVSAAAGNRRRVTATFGGAVVAEAEPGVLTGDVVSPVSFDNALERMSRFAGDLAHPFPRCFVCGTQRPAPDGLGLRPGRLDDRPDTVASGWVPHSAITDEGRVPPAMVWAALDCPGGWSADLVGRPMVLGRVTAAVDAVPDVGDSCVVVGQFRGKQGRKTFTATTAYDGEGRILGRAEAIWFDVDPAAFGAR